MPRWLIDLFVWIVAFGAIGVGAVGVWQATEPPTVEERMAAAQETVLQQCLADTTLKMPGSAQRPYCGCLANAVWYRGGGTPTVQDASRCRARAAKQIVASADVKQSFSDTFPQSCAASESRAVGRQMSLSSPYCTCIISAADENDELMALLAVGGTGSDDRVVAANEKCQSMMTLGAGWRTYTMDDGRTMMELELPAFTSLARSLRFFCTDGVLSFGAFGPNSQPLPVPASFHFDTPEGDGMEMSAEAADVTVRTLLDWLVSLDDEYIRASVGFYDTSHFITVSGIEKAREELLAKCPATAAKVVTADTATDPWHEIGPAAAFFNEDDGVDSFATVVCDDPPPYIGIASSRVTGLRERFPPTTQGLLATEVPVSFDVGGKTFSDLGNCQMDGGGGEVCYIALTREMIEAMASSPSMRSSLAGETFMSVAAGSSKTLAEVLQVCLAGVTD
jgi:hypothetical protein